MHSVTTNYHYNRSLTMNIISKAAYIDLRDSMSEYRLQRTTNPDTKEESELILIGRVRVLTKIRQMVDGKPHDTYLHFPQKMPK